MYLKVKQWMPSFTFKFWIICVNVLAVWGQKCEEIESSFFSTIMRVHTLQRSSSSFCPKKEWHSSLSIFARLKTPRLFRFPKIKIGAERWPLCFHGSHSEICNCEPGSYYLLPLIKFAPPPKFIPIFYFSTKIFLKYCTNQAEKFEIGAVKYTFSFHFNIEL